MYATMTSLRHDVTASLLLLLLAMTSAVSAVSGDGGESGCAGLGYCCPGRNVTCASTGRSAGSKDATSTCFCDEACLNIGDCCLDYRDACPRRYLCIVNAVRRPYVAYVRNAGRGQLSSE